MIIIKKADTILNDILNFNYDLALVPMSIYNSMNRGYAYDIALNFPVVKEAEKLMPYGDKRRYGTFSEVNYPFIKFVLCYVHTGGYNRGVFIDYDSLRACLNSINKKFKGKKIISPIIGVSEYDGNGDKDKIIDIFKETCKDIDVDLYDYEQEDTKLLFFRQIAELRDKFLKRNITSDEYKKRRSEIEWKRRNGIFKPMPDDYVYTPKGNKIG